MKQCSKCGIEKSDTDFGKDKRNIATGLQSQCRQCQLASQASRREKLLAEYEERMKNLSDTGKLTPKKCYACKIVKELSDFHCNRSNVDGRANRCIDCESIHSAKYYEEHSEQIKDRTNQYYWNNLEDCKINRKKYAQANAEACNARTRKWAHNNPDKVLNKNRKYRQENPEKAREIRRNYAPVSNQRHHERYDTEPEYRMTCLIRSMTRLTFKRQSATKNAQTNEYLGCSVDQCMALLKGTLSPDANIDDYHIDHIIPVSRFNFGTEDAPNLDHIYACCHYSNLQLLTPQENLSKHDGPDNYDWATAIEIQVNCVKALRGDFTINHETAHAA